MSLELIEHCLDYQPNHLELLSLLAKFQLKVENYPASIQAAQQVLALSQDPIQQAVARAELLKILITAGDWSNIKSMLTSFRQDLELLPTLPDIRFDSGLLQNLLVKTGSLAYLQDHLSENRHYQNLVADLFVKSLQKILPQPPTQFPAPVPKPATEKLKIGYIGSTFHRHSVSWLNRWLFQHHNKQEFEIYIYSFGDVLEDPFFKAWFEPQVHFIAESRNKTGAIIRKIKDDKIDILVDLDSYTLDLTCTIMAAKPAPIQVTWLGTDASGLSTIDYYIADPYVLPEDAQAHYREKIWRLPQTYIAVDGFEVGYPTLHRQDLDIPANAIVYYSSQVAFKRHPETMRLQLEIIKQVPDSYLLIKGIGDPQIIKTYFTELANEVGVSVDRLRFLEPFASEYDHRGTLDIADIILDTYPYSGATTTLEALWVGVPLVTRVGETFSSRNSYAFLMNAGVTEGIAWSAQEYLDWGIRLGTDIQLRQDVAWKLYQSRHHSPLWDAKQFTHEMEAAYKQMWDIYCSAPKL
jgi:predicted O-linked N-acetylglucosamine transferase (SPINDLY family)